MSTLLSYLLLPLKWLFYINLLFLPFTFVPYFGGFVDGVLYTFQASRLASRAQENYSANLKSAAYLTYFAGEGAPNPLDTPVAPFHVVEIRTPDLWWQRMGLGRLSKYAGTPKEEHEPMEELASLDNLYWLAEDLDVDEPSQPFHHFIYLSDSVLVGDEGLWFNDWDKAFNELLKHHDMEPAVWNASFTWMNCRRSFLCDTWRARGPAFLHLTTETPSVHTRDEELEKSLAARPSTSKSVPLSARLIEFRAGQGNDGTQRLVKPGQFPSPYEQMLALTASPDNWELFPVHSQFTQTLTWFGDYCERLEKQYPTTYGRIAEAETWLRERYEPEGIPLVVNLHFLAFLVASGPLALLTPALKTAWHYVSLFLGTSVEDRLRRESYAAKAWEEAHERGDEGANDEALMEGMLAGFINNQGPEFRKALEGSDEARRLVADMWKAIRGSAGVRGANGTASATGKNGTMNATGKNGTAEEQAEAAEAKASS